LREDLHLDWRSPIGDGHWRYRPDSTPSLESETAEDR
jgi:hypothetical protein